MILTDRYKGSGDEIRNLKILNSNEYKRQQLKKHQLFTADACWRWLNLNKQCFFYLTAMIICFARCWDFKVIPFNVMSGGSDMVSNISWRVIIFCWGLEVFSLAVMEPSLSFTNVKIIAIPTTSFVNDFRSLRAIKVVLAWKERFNMAGVLKNYF